MIDLRLRTKIPAEELQEKVGKILTENDYNVLITRECLVRKPDGTPLCIYLPAAIPLEIREAAYPILHELHRKTTRNRGKASGTQRPKLEGKDRRNESAAISSVLLGAFEKGDRGQSVCRLTAWTGDEAEKFGDLLPFFRFIGDAFRDLVPDRYSAQMAEVDRTDPAWTIDGTPFTTITVNNTYSTGVHTDKGDLDSGFSNLTVLRRGQYVGGVLVFPEYRVGVDMRDGDLLLMDAHEWHGNTPLFCEHSRPKALRKLCPSCDAERISVVAYYRTNMVKCGTPDDEAAKRKVYEDQRAAAMVGE
jgi:hypothetical protein